MAKVSIGVLLTIQPISIAIAENIAATDNSALAWEIHLRRIFLSCNSTVNEPRKLGMGNASVDWVAMVVGKRGCFRRFGTEKGLRDWLANFR